MSLINNLLKDMESRQTALPDGQDIVLDGLYSAYDVEIQEQESKKNYFYYLLAIFLFAVLFISVSRINIISPAEKADTSSSLPLAKVPAENHPSIPAVVVGEKEKLEVKSRVSDAALFSLKVDDVLANQENLFPSGDQITQHQAIIKNIILEESAREIMLSMHIPDESQYVLYTLSNPNRTVLEIDNVDNAESLPGIEQLSTVTNIRKKLAENGKFTFVVESSMPLFIDNTSIAQVAGQHVLQVSLQKKEKEQETSVALTENTSVRENDSDTAAMHGELVKTIHQPNVYSVTEKLLIKGLDLYQQGKIAEGLDALYAAVKSDESHVKARATLAINLIQQNQRDQAMIILDDGLRLYPDKSEWARLLAQSQIDAGDLVSAQKVMEKSIPSISADPDYHALYAALLQKMELHQQAALTYRNLLNAFPDNGIWWMGLAISLEALSRNRDALYAYSNALKGHSLTNETNQYITQRMRVLNQMIANESP